MKANSSQNDKENSTDNSSAGVHVEKSESGKSSPTNITETTEPIIKYVEAPIPKVNPWKKNDMSTANVDQPNVKNPLSDSCKSDDKNTVDDKSTDTSISNKDTSITMQASEIIQSEKGSTQVNITDNSTINPINTTVDSKKSSPKNSKANTPQDTSSFSKQHMAEVENTTVKVAGCNTAWKNSADSISKIAPSMDGKVSV